MLRREFPLRVVEGQNLHELSRAIGNFKHPALLVLSGQRIVGSKLLDGFPGVHQGGMEVG